MINKEDSSIKDWCYIATTTPPPTTPTRLNNRRRRRRLILIMNNSRCYQLNCVLSLYQNLIGLLLSNRIILLLLGIFLHIPCATSFLHSSSSIHHHNINPIKISRFGVLEQQQTQQHLLAAPIRTSGEHERTISPGWSRRAYSTQNRIKTSLDVSSIHHPSSHAKLHSEISSSIHQEGQVSKCPFAKMSRLFNNVIHNNNGRNNIEKILNNINDVIQHIKKSAAIETITTTIDNDNKQQLRDDPLIYPWEEYIIDTFEIKYQEALSMHCPFLRRRLTDIYDTIDTVLRKHIYRSYIVNHVLDVPPSIRCSNDNNVNESEVDNNNNNNVLMKKKKVSSNSNVSCSKLFHLSINEMISIIQNDYSKHNNKGYYITGKVNTAIYRNDCYFNSPDPDMPIIGLNKYINAASQLFDYKTSTCQLLSIQQYIPNINNNDDHDIILSNRNDNDSNDNNIIIEAKWCMNGVLRLPFLPTLPTVTGTTYYYLDYMGLITKHIETWDNINAIQAFYQTFIVSNKFKLYMIQQIQSFISSHDNKHANKYNSNNKNNKKKKIATSSYDATTTTS